MKPPESERMVLYIGDEALTEVLVERLASGGFNFQVVADPRVPTDRIYVGDSRATLADLPHLDTALGRLEVPPPLPPDQGDDLKALLATLPERTLNRRERRAAARKGRTP